MITKKEFNKLQVGDLVEWRNIITRDPNPIGVVTESLTFDSVFENIKTHQIRIKWNKYNETCVHNDKDDNTLCHLSIIAKAKK